MDESVLRISSHGPALGQAETVVLVRDAREVDDDRDRLARAAPAEIGEDVVRGVVRIDPFEAGGFGVEFPQLRVGDVQRR